MTVLIIADDAEFSRAVIDRWRAERPTPEFAVLGSSVFQVSAGSAKHGDPGITGDFDLAILGPLPISQMLALARVLTQSGAPALAVAADLEMMHRLRDEFPRLLVLRQQDGWPDVLVLLAAESLRRLEATARALQAEQRAAAANRCAVLGQYMLEMRHNLNNALTGVLGNAELLLLQPAKLSAETREQVQTIHAMALRMHQVLQRFSSLDAELQFAAEHQPPAAEPDFFRAGSSS